MICLKSVHFGAGNIGRGFIGEILSKNGFEICFVDVNQNIIDDINQNNNYTVQIVGEEKKRHTIGNVRAFNLKNQEKDIIDQIQNADVITTSIGINNFEDISNIISKGLILRKNMSKPLDVIANENAVNATDILKEKIKMHLTEEEWESIQLNVGFANSTVDRQALNTTYNGKIIPLVEPYFEWVINYSELKNKDLKKIHQIKFVDYLLPFIERKLYIVNAGHSVASYLGYQKGYRTIQEALSDNQIFEFVKLLMLENSRYLISEYQMEKEELELFISKILTRFTNPFLEDEIKRVARNPIRKIGPKERIVGPLIKLRDLDLSVHYGEKALAFALLYGDRLDSEAIELKQSLNTRGVKMTLKEYCNITDSRLINKIEQYINDNSEELIESIGGDSNVS